MAFADMWINWQNLKIKFEFSLFVQPLIIAIISSKFQKQKIYFQKNSLQRGEKLLQQSLPAFIKPQIIFFKASLKITTNKIN